MQIVHDRYGIPWVKAAEKRDHSESWEQQVLIQRAMGWIVAHVPNGGKRSKSEAERLRREGVMAGFPDLVCIRQGVVVFVEMKRTKNGALHGEQKHVIPALMRAGAEVYVCEGWEAALWSLEHGKRRPWN